MDDPCNPCPGQCPDVFDRIVVRHFQVRGGTRVLWELLPTFTDPNPLVFQLQVGRTANNDADDWEDVGLPVENMFSATDPEQRVFGKLNYTHYRIVLTTPKGTYTSPPVGGMGVLDRRDWLFAREKVRQRKLDFKKGRAAQEGFLLKRRWTGVRCPVCLNLQTQESQNPDCPSCYGTGYQCGYYYPMGCCYAKLGPKSRRTELDGGQGRGTIDDIVVQADFLMTDLLAEDDVWVAKRTDDRYYVHRVNHVTEVRGVPIEASVELRPIPFTSSIYTIAIPDQLSSAEV